MRLTYNDRQHAYWLDGKRCKGVTTVAKIPEDTHRLDKWKSRQVVIGMATSPPLVSRAAAHFDERDKIDDIAEEAMAAAKAYEAAGRGTAAHRITERVDLGLDWIDTPEARTIRDQWTAALDQAGLDIVPDLVERIVVYPDELVAGRFDRIARRRTDGRLVVVDVKTGVGAVKYPHATCIQLGLYANAPLMAGPLERTGDKETTEVFEPLPGDLDRTVGVIVYLPPEGPADIYELDIAAGWETARTICFPTIAWRKANGLVVKVASEPGISEAAPPVEPAAAADQDPGGAGQSDAGVRDDTPASLDRIQWLKTRMQAIKDAGHIADLQAEWPPGVPGFLSTPPLSTDRHVSLVADACSKVEAKRGMPFGAVDPLFACFNQPAEQPAYERPASVDVGLEADRAEAKAWADKARRLLDRWEPGDQTAICAVAHVDPKATMTEAMYQRLEAVDFALDLGVLDWEFGPYGPSIVVNPKGEVSIRNGSTKTYVLSHVKPIARELGLPAPRKYDDVASSPTLAALAAYLTTPNTNITGKQEQ